MEPNTKTAEPASARGPVVTDDGEQMLTDRATRRAALERTAAKVLGDKETLGALSDRQVREKAILKVCADVSFVDADGKARSDAYVEGMFDVLLANDGEPPAFNEPPAAEQGS